MEWHIFQRGRLVILGRPHQLLVSGTFWSPLMTNRCGRFLTCRQPHYGSSDRKSKRFNNVVSFFFFIAAEVGLESDSSMCCIICPAVRKKKKLQNEISRLIYLYKYAELFSTHRQVAFFFFIVANLFFDIFVLICFCCDKSRLVEWPQTKRAMCSSALKKNI